MKVFRDHWWIIPAVLLATGCPQRPSSTLISDEPQGPPLFKDITAQSGIDYTYRNGEEANHYSILESIGGGVALIDYDRDGRLDVFLTGGGYFDGTDKQSIQGHPSRLYRNLGEGKFQDVTAEAGLGQPLFYTNGATVGDYNADGWPDLVVTGYGRVVLYHNEAAGNTGRGFRDVTEEAGLNADQHFWTTSAAFGDLDGDGLPELYLCQYVNWSFRNHPRCDGNATNVPHDICSPRRFDSMPDRLYQNLGPDKMGRVTFRNVSAEAGLRVPPRDDRDYGKGLGVLFVDVNGDGKPDIYVANDTTDNFLYLNESTPGKLHFQDKGFECLAARDGLGEPNGSMGVDGADYDGSGFPSLWVVNYEGEPHALYRNTIKDGRLWFRFSTQTSGIAAIGQSYVGFGTAFIDVDLDGWEDLVVSNGHVLHHPSRSGAKQKPVLMRNQGDATFKAITRRGGDYFQGDHRGRGLAVGDLDNDGFPDLVISHANEPVVVLKHLGDSSHWIGLVLDRPGHRDFVGARVTVQTPQHKRVRFAKAGGSYLSSGDRRIVVGLGAEEKVEKITVEWPSGEPRVQHFDGPAVGRYWRIEQGQPKLLEGP